MALYKGLPYVTTRIYSTRNELGVWVTVYEYAGIRSSMLALANSFLLGVAVTYEERGAVCYCSVTWGNNQGTDSVSEKWEIDKEILDKDIMYKPQYASMSDPAKLEIKRWRGDPSSDLDLTKANGGTGSAEATLMGQIKTLVLRGTDSVQVFTLVLKRTRTMSIAYATTINLADQLSIYSTATLATNENIPALIANRLPTAGAGTLPADLKWAWLPRMANRSYIGRGLIEELNDWVFAAWTTFLYTYS